VSALVDTLLWQIKVAKLPKPMQELRFFPPRRWRFDLSWEKHMLAVEVEGGIWTRGRHSRGKGFEADCHKYNAAQLVGWRVLRVTGGMIEDGSALSAITIALGGAS